MTMTTGQILLEIPNGGLRMFCAILKNWRITMDPFLVVRKYLKTQSFEFADIRFILDMVYTGFKII